MKDIHKDADAHWQYTCELITKANPDLDDDVVELMRFLYCAAFVHGAKHEAAGDYADSVDNRIATDIKNMVDEFAAK